MSKIAIAQPQKIASPANASAHAGLLQRKCACGGMAGLTGQCAECDKERLSLRRNTVNQSASSPVPPILAIVGEVLHSSGQSLDGSTRAQMESRFGHDFGQVRGVVHEVRAGGRAGHSLRPGGRNGRC